MFKPSYIVTLLIAAAAAAARAQTSGFSINQIKSLPFPNELVASPRGSRIAYALNEEGKRNVWVAEGPQYKARQLTNYMLDDGQELTSLSISADGKYVVY